MRAKSSLWKRGILLLILAGILSYTTLFAIVQWGNRDQIVGEPQIMIVLGCLVMPSGVPSVLLQDRLDEAYDYWEEHPQMTIVVSGGQGSDEPTTEAQCMAEYLVERGVPETQILQEDQSHNTDQNLRHSVALLTQAGYDPEGDIMIVSNGFHLTRAKLLWNRAGGDVATLSVLAAPSSYEPSRIHMNLREPLALVKSFLFDR